MQFLKLDIADRVRELIARYGIILFPCAIGVLFVFAYLSSSIHDYGAYLAQWQNILSGGDPWATENARGELPINAYGPLHVFFADLVRLHPLAPKFVTGFLTICVIVLAFALPADRDTQRRAATDLAWIYVLSPLVAITVFAFGINDGVVGALILMACLLRTRKAYGATGVVLGLAALLKFYPLLFVPFFAVTRSGVLRMRTLLCAAATFGLGMGLAWLYWGNSALSPFFFGDSREPKHLSILRFLDEFKELLSIQAQVDYLLDINSIAVLAGVVLVAAWGWLTRQGWEVTSLLGVLAIFMIYKVGHQQFYVSWIALYAWIIATSGDTRSVLIARAFTPTVVFLALYQMLYFASFVLTRTYFEGGWAVFRVVGSVLLLGAVIWSLKRAFPHLKGREGPSVSVRL